MRLSSRVAVGSPTFRLASIMAITLALVLALGAAVVTGASLIPTKLPDPFGLARNGSLVYHDTGDIWVADATGANGRAIITGPENDSNPWFSHDGTRFAFGRDDSRRDHAPDGRPRRWHRDRPLDRRLRLRPTGPPTTSSWS